MADDGRDDRREGQFHSRWAPEWDRDDGVVSSDPAGWEAPPRTKSATATPVRMRGRTFPWWVLLALCVAAFVLIGGGIGIYLGRQAAGAVPTAIPTTVPTAVPPSPTALPQPTATPIPPQTLVRNAVLASDDAWRNSNETASDQGLAQTKTGQELADDEAGIRQLAAKGERWDIRRHSFHVDWIKLTSATSAQAQYSKNETSTLYAGSRTLELLDGPYQVSAWLTLEGSVWKVSLTQPINVVNRVKYRAPDAP